MKFEWDQKELKNSRRCILLTDGLGGYCSVTDGFGVNRADQGILVAAVKAPNVRRTLVHRLRDTLQVGPVRHILSRQRFADGTEEGGETLCRFSCEKLPVWTYEADGVRVERTCAVARGENRTALLYTIENCGHTACTLEAEPMMKFAPREQARTEPAELKLNGRIVCSGEERMWIHTDGEIATAEPRWEWLAYPEDEKDGRAGAGMAGSCCRITMTVQPGETASLHIVFSEDDSLIPARQIRQQALECQNRLVKTSPYPSEIARVLTRAADAYIVWRDSTKGLSILAGYPLFSDWGRDTMLALPGLCLATGRYEEAWSILRTFLSYEKDGLVPNFFPEGAEEPIYNAADAALLLISSVWQLYRHTKNTEYVREAYPTMEQIIRAYREGTRYGIHMDADGLILAGEGNDQVTWMDVRIGDQMPTPRHGKPVEINAAWYQALRIMEALAPVIGADGKEYGLLARKVRTSFVGQFYLEDRGYLKDVISGTDADTQIRCNQIWAVTLDFPLLSPEQERSVVETVEKHLYTPRGLRTLSPEDPQFHPFYGGSQVQRDLAYHQGTVWVFPLGAYYRAVLKVRGMTEEAAKSVKARLLTLESMLTEDCIGQLPELYDGLNPREGKGCFAQAWSVGEMLRVYETIAEIEQKTNEI